METHKTYKLDPSIEPRIRSELEKAGFSFMDSQYAFWRAGDGETMVTFYKTGKLLVQGRDIEELINYLEGTRSAVSRRRSVPFDKWIGTDESGKGDYFGPLVVAGALVTEATRKELLSSGVKDSKLLSDTAIKKLAPYIKTLCPHSIIVRTPAKYNKTYETMQHYGKLHRILAWGHAEAIKNILKKESCQHAISDQFGPERFLSRALVVRGIHITLEQRFHAEDDIAVAAASILPRDTYIKSLESLSLRYLIDLTPGASQKVIEAGREFVLGHGPERLREVAKLHFSTTEYILNPDMVQETQSTDFNPEFFMSIDD